MFDLKLRVDTHVHSINSVHAYSTISENAVEAAKKNIECIVITDHFGPEFVNATLFQSYAGITNIRNIPSYLNDVRIMNGVEIDIVDQSGNLAFYDTFFSFDLQKSVAEKVVEKSDVVIASYHDIYGFALNYNLTTEMLAAVLRNPNVNILGHCDRMLGDFDLDYILSVANKENKFIELNCHSLALKPERAKRIIEIMQKCAKANVLVTVCSDAHFANEVGTFEQMTAILKKVSFPSELIVSMDTERFVQALRTQKAGSKVLFD